MKIVKNQIKERKGIMIIKFGYYDDEDFGLTAFPEIRFSEMEIEKNKKKNK